MTGLLLCWVLISHSEAQTVEAVLRSLQERKMVSTWRGGIEPGPIVWPHLSTKYPKDGDYKDIRNAIDALNVASLEFDQLKQNFLAYDPTGHQPVNVTHEIRDPGQDTNYDSNQLYTSTSGGWVSGDASSGVSDVIFFEGDRSLAVQSTGTRLKAGRIRLPSVGVFDEENWRDKIRLLASGIDQLKALDWNVTADVAITQAWQYYGVNLAPDADLGYNSPGSGWKHSVDFTFSFPFWTGVHPSESAFVLKNMPLSGYPAFSSVVRGKAYDSDGAPGYSFQDKDGNGYPTQEWDDTQEPPGPGKDDEVWTGGEGFALINLNQGFQIGSDRCVVQTVLGLKATVDGDYEEFGQGIPKIKGGIALFKSPGVSPYGDLAEPLAKVDAKRLTLGGWTRVTSLMKEVQPGKFELGNLSQRQTTVSSGDGELTNQYGLDSRSAYNACRNLLELPELTLSGNKLTKAPGDIDHALDLKRREFMNDDFPNEDDVDLYVFDPTQGPKIRRGYDWIEGAYDAQSIHRADVNLDAVFEGKFTPCLPSGAKMAPLRRPVGEILLTPEFVDLVRIFIGRGKSDKNQEGWIGTRPDGFGSLLFFGSPDEKEFELIYETNPAEFKDAPLGGVTFDSDLRFSPDERNASGWPDRFTYIAAWFTPRLMQVRSHDVLVDITYENPYKKKLKFYWASKAGSKSGKIYQPNGGPFKTITIENPTAQATGLPENRYELKLEEEGKADEGKRISTAKYDRIDLDPQANPRVPIWEWFEFKQSGPGAGDRVTTINIDYDDPQGLGYLPPMQPWVVTETFEGKETKTTIDYGLGRNGSPLETERSDIYKIDVQIDGQEEPTRTIVWEFQETAVGYIWWLPKNISYSGDPAWSKNGAKISFDSRGFFESSEQPFAGTKLKVVDAWTGVNCERKWQIQKNNAFQTFQSSTRKNAQDLRKITHTFGSKEICVEEYRDPDSATFIPWSLSKRTYPEGGFSETYELSRGGLSAKIKNGWGQGQTAGEQSVLERNDAGGLISATVTSSEGILLQRETGSDYTDWGIPKKITSLDGGVTETEYKTTGFEATLLDRITDSAKVEAKMGTRDWLLRPAKVTTTFEELTFVRSNPLQAKVISSAGPTAETTFSNFGDVLSGSDTSGVGSSFSLTPGGNSTVTVGQSTVSVGVDASGFLSSVGNGGFSLGAGIKVGFENDMIYSEVTERNRTGTLGSNYVKTYFDQRGRIAIRKRLGVEPGAGANVTEVWTHDEGSRSVTWAPGVGPRAQSVTSALSPDGKIRTISVGVDPMVREVRAANGKKLELKTEIQHDGAEGALPGAWTEVSCQSIDPSARTLSFIPWKLGENESKITTSAPDQVSTVTTKDGFTGQSVTTTINKGFEKDGTKGVRTNVNGKVNGVQVDLTTEELGLLSETNGTIGGQTVGRKFLSDGRIGETSGPGSKQVFTYADDAAGSTVSITDDLQGTTSSISINALGDVTAYNPARGPKLTLATVDADSGSKVTVNEFSSPEQKLTLSFDPLRSLIGKDYEGALGETYKRSNIGSVMESTIVGSGVDGVESRTTTIEEDAVARTRTIDFGDGTVFGETRYKVGLRKTVTGPEDDRNFSYERFSLKKETHNAGPWSGWTVERKFDTRGRLSAIQVKQGGAIVRQFDVGYDAVSRFSKSSTRGFSATYGDRTALGALQTLTRTAGTGASVSSTWHYDAGLLTKLENAANGGDAYNYEYKEYDARRRIGKREASPGVSWSGIIYGDKDELKGARLLNAGREVTYGYNSRGNRISQWADILQMNAGADPEVQMVAPGLDRVTTRTLTKRGFGLVGNVRKDADLFVTHQLTAGWKPLSVDDQTGAFFDWSDIPSSFSSDGGWINATLRATLSATKPNGPAAAEADIAVMVPPSSEVLKYDGEGRLVIDAFWTYGWNGAGQLKSMTRSALTRPPGVTDELLTFGYDADGRRTKKTHTVEKGNITTVEESKVLWDGWLPVLELRSKDGVFTGRRWFQWGADCSGTFGGAGGIGGLLAIIEEDAAGATKRVLLPVQDGLGNITAVINGADGQTVARYEFGPFGEPLGGSGEIDACPFRWQSKWFDTETDHYYFGYRYYNPRLGRWHSRDPLGEAGGFNLYAYCGNDPVNRHDPLGLAEIYIGRNGDGDPILSSTARVIDGVPKVHYSDWSHWYGPVFGGARHDWWQEATPAQIDQYFMQTPSGWRMKGADARIAAYNRQSDAAAAIAARNAMATVNTVAKLHYGAMAIASCPVLLLEAPLTWGTGAAFFHEAYAGTALLSGAFTGEDYATSPEGALLRAYGAPEGAVMLTDSLVPVGAPFLVGRGPQLQMPGPKWNPLNYRVDLATTNGPFGIGKWRYVGPRIGDIQRIPPGNVLSLAGESVGFTRSTYRGSGYVYMLRDCLTKMILKVGKTSGAGNIYERFNLYRRKGLQRGYDLEVEFWEVDSARGALDLEAEIRKNLQESGFSLPWDGMTQDNKFAPWKGLPWRRTSDTPYTLE